MPTGKRGSIGMIKPAGKDLSSLRPYEVRKQGINNTIKGRRVKKSEKQK